MVRSTSPASCLVLLGALVAACSATPDPTPVPVQVSQPPVDQKPIPDVGFTSDAGADTSTSPPDAAVTVDPAFPHGRCADTFGDALTVGFGRIDGTLQAVVTPEDKACTFPNNDHIVLQVLMGGKVYRLVASLGSTRTGVDPRMRFATTDAPMPAPVWAEGWHTGMALDYNASLMLGMKAFKPYEQNELVTAILAELHIGEPVSVYATSGKGRPESAHLIHRNDNGTDGAIVIRPTSATPRFLAFHFDGQRF